MIFTSKIKLSRHLKLVQHRTRTNRNALLRGSPINDELNKASNSGVTVKPYRVQCIPKLCSPNKSHKAVLNDLE